MQSYNARVVNFCDRIGGLVAGFLNGSVPLLAESLRLNPIEAGQLAAGELVRIAVATWGQPASIDTATLNKLQAEIIDRVGEVCGGTTFNATEGVRYETRE